MRFAAFAGKFGESIFKFIRKYIEREIKRSLLISYKLDEISALATIFKT